MTPGPDAPHRPIFIVGSNGSGSTLLRLMLDSHERIAIPEETGFLRLAAAHRWVPYWRLGGDWYANLGLTEDQLYAELGRFYGGLFSSYAASRGKPRWGDKTPFHVWHLELATQMFPDAVVVGIVRHPGAVVSSTRRRFGRSLKASIRHWLRTNRQLVISGCELGDRFVLLRYEDLVAEPERVMRDLLEWLGEPWSPAVLAHHEVQPAGESTGFTRTDRPIDTESVARWETELPEPARERIIARTGALARFLGYDPAGGSPPALAASGPTDSTQGGSTQGGSGPSDSTPSGSTQGTSGPSDSTSWMITGTALAAMRDRSSDLDWTPPKRLLEDRPLRPPPPRRRARGAPNLDRLTFRQLAAHRLRNRS